MSKDQWNEFLIYFKNRPIAFLIIEMVGRISNVVKLPGIGYFINDPDIGKQVLRIPEVFNSSDKGSVGYLITQVLGDFALINMDGLKHKELKTRLRELFTPKYIDEAFEMTAKSFLLEVKADLITGKEVDIAEISKILAGRMACAMIGAEINDQEAKKLFFLTSKFTSFAGLGKQELNPNEVLAATALAEEIGQYALKSYKNSKSDNSVTQRLRDLGFEFEEIKALLTVILVGGTELVAFAIPRIVALLIDSGQMGLLKKDPELMTQTIDEGLRMVTPSSIILRSIVEDVEIENVKFKKGNRALIVNYNMLKSKKYFTNPRKFDITRKIDSSVKHTWFGGGPHFCMGFALAHKEIKSVLELMIGLEGNLKILSRGYVKNKVFPGYSKLILKLV